MTKPVNTQVLSVSKIELTDKGGRVTAVGENSWNDSYTFTVPDAAARALTIGQQVMIETSLLPGSAPQLAADE